MGMEIYGNYQGFSDHFAVNVAIWGFLVVSTLFIIFAGAFGKNE